MAARFDEHARAARVAESRKVQAMARAAKTGVYSIDKSGPVASDVINGRTHPELYFPTELFEQLVTMIYTWKEPDFWRRAFAQESRDILVTAKEWREFDALTSEYGANLRRDYELYFQEDRATRSERMAIEQQRDRLHGDKCALEKMALRRVREKFGREKFDRFLYVAVAPKFSDTVAPENNFEETRERIRRDEESCQ